MVHTKVCGECVDGSDSSSVDGVVLGVEVIVRDCRDEEVDHLRQVVFQQADHLLERLQRVQVDLTVGLLQPGLEGIKHLGERNKEEAEGKEEIAVKWSLI